MDKINNIGLSRLMSSVYDFDGLTEQEIWCRIAQKINIIIEHFNYIDNKVDNEIDKNKVKFDYLLGKGLSEQIAKELIKRFEDGTLQELINNSMKLIISEVKEISESVTLLNKSLSNVAKSGSYTDLFNRPTKLSDFTNDLFFEIPNSGNVNSNINNINNIITLNKYQGNTLGDKMVTMFTDINKNHNHTPMVIILPDGIIEITSNLKAVGWTNKIFIGNTYLYFNKCDGIEFIKCKHCKFYIHASSSSNLDIAKDNTIGLISPNSVSNLQHRGYKISDCSYNKFIFNNIIGFTNGIEFYSEYGGEGTCYNDVYYTAIWRCQRPYIFKTGKAQDDSHQLSGWITEISIHGGMFDCDDGILIGQEPKNRPTNEPSDTYQGLKFYNTGVEHIRKKDKGVAFYFLQGKNNVIFNPRFEGSLGAGNDTSGAYILIKESGDSWNNKVETSNFPINIDRVILNHSVKQNDGIKDCICGSYIVGDLRNNQDGRVGEKMIATPGKIMFEVHNMPDYYFTNYSKPNTINYTCTETVFAKVKCSNGLIKTIGYTS